MEKNAKLQHKNVKSCAFWVTLYLLWGQCGHMMRTCASRNPRCGQNTHFSNEFQWFYKSLWGYFGVPLGSLCALWDHFGGTLGSLWAMKGSLGHFGITLESPLVCEGQFSKNTHSVQYMLMIFCTTLVSTCGHFGVTLRYFGYMEVTLDHSWVTLSPLGMAFEHTMRICAFKSLSVRNMYIFPLILNVFINRMHLTDRKWVSVCQNWVSTRNVTFV